MLSNNPSLPVPVPIVHRFSPMFKASTCNVFTYSQGISGLCPLFCSFGEQAGKEKSGQVHNLVIDNKADQKEQDSRRYPYQQEAYSIGQKDLNTISGRILH